MSTPPRVIHVRLFRRRYWEVFEREGVEPFYLEKSQAVYYAQQRGRLGNATVRIYDEQGQVEREIEPPKEEQMLYYPSRRRKAPPSGVTDSESEARRRAVPHSQAIRRR